MTNLFSDDFDLDTYLAQSRRLGQAWRDPTLQKLTLFCKSWNIVAPKRPELPTSSPL